MTSSDDTAQVDTAQVDTAQVDTAQVDPVIDRIRQSVHALDTIAEQPLSEHADAYENVHSRLQGELAEIDGGTTSS